MSAPVALADGSVTLARGMPARRRHRRRSYRARFSYPQDDYKVEQTMTRNSGYPRRSGYEYVPDGFYVEPRWVVDLMLDNEAFEGNGLDPCCGTGTIVSVCRDRGLSMRGSDLRDHGFGERLDMFDITERVDFIISNFPYGSKHDGRHIHERVEHCLNLVRRKMVLILPMTFWESRERYPFFHQYPPLWFAPCSDRPSMPPGHLDGERDHHGAIIQPPSSGGTAPYGWFGWKPGYQGETRVRLFGLKPSRRVSKPPQPMNEPADNSGLSGRCCVAHS
jgi:hypothetical protein